MKVNNDLIYDLGMHNGQDSDFYLKKGYRVVAVEANPQLVEGGPSAVSSELASGQLSIEDIAISEDFGEATFFVNQTNSKWSSLFENWGQRGKGAVEIVVPTVPFSSILEKYGVPYYLKIDIEGADALVLHALSDSPALPPFVSVEGGGPVHA